MALILQLFIDVLRSFSTLRQLKAGSPSGTTEMCPSFSAAPPGLGIFFNGQPAVKTAGCFRMRLRRWGKQLRAGGRKSRGIPAQFPNALVGWRKWRRRRGNEPPHVRLPQMNWDTGFRSTTGTTGNRVVRQWEGKNPPPIICQTTQRKRKSR